MKNLLRIISLALVACMLFSFAACAPQTNPADTGKGADGTNDPAGEENTTKYADIAGEYLLDGSNLGMPMKWYIKVSADGKFVISTERDYATVKGEGTIGDKDGTYMFVYSDSTTETPKTATFKFEGKNMVFSTKVPIGAASLSPNEEEQKYPTAKLIANEDILGSYLGTLEKSAMGSAVVYSFALDLVIGGLKAQLDIHGAVIVLDDLVGTLKGGRLAVTDQGVGNLGSGNLAALELIGRGVLQNCDIDLSGVSTGESLTAGSKHEQNGGQSQNQSHNANRLLHCDFLLS